MSSEYNNDALSSDPNANNRRPSFESWRPWEVDNDDTQPHQAIRPASISASPEPGPRQFGTRGSSEPQSSSVDPQFIYCEHLTGPLPAAYPPPMQAQRYPAPGQNSPAFLQPQAPGYPPQRPAYPPPYPAHQGYYPSTPYPGYPAYPAYPGYPPYAWQQPRPKRDGYLFGIAITAFIGSILVLLAGLGSLFVLALLVALPHTGSLSASNYFAGVAFFVALTAAGLLGGSFSLYHSIRSLFLHKPSANFVLPRFWIFVLLYVAVLALGLLLQAQAAEVKFPLFTLTLIMLAGAFPALAVLALGVRRLRSKRDGQRTFTWPTSWRRFTLALVSGATASILLASILEFIFQIILLHGQNANTLLCIDRPDAPNCQAPGVYGLLFVLVAVMAPLVEETVKPLAVVFLITKVRSAAEAFILGLACGIGFDLIETTGYISSGYHDWLSVALIRTSAGLLHGFGAAMVALGWYYLIHAKKRRFLLASACWLYAVLQHALWNGSWGLTLLPAPLGPAIDNWNVNLGFTTLPFYLVINFIEVVFMLAFFVYITGRLRTKTPVTTDSKLGEERNRTIEGQRRTAVSM